MEKPARREEANPDKEEDDLREEAHINDTMWQFDDLRVRTSTKNYRRLHGHHSTKNYRRLHGYQLMVMMMMMMMVVMMMKMKDAW